MRTAPVCARLLAAALLLSVAPKVALAQDPDDYPTVGSGNAALRSGIGQHGDHWSDGGPARPFLAATFDVGALYLRPTLAAGYGTPHHRWIGMEIHSGLSTSSGTGYAGVRGALPGFDARVGARYELPISQGFLPAQATFVREDVETERYGQAYYVALEAELSGSVDVPGGSILAVATGYSLLGVPAGRWLFEESLSVVAAPPFLLRGRLGYLRHVDEDATMKLGGAAEIIGIPEREAFVVRAGPLLTVSLTSHLQALAAMMLVVESPDSLGLVGADLGQLGLRYQWATGDDHSDFP